MSLSKASMGLGISLWAVGQLAAGSTAAWAQDEAFKGKTIQLLISHPPGGGYDTYARLYARHLQRFLPGQPTIVAQNMPGAGGVAMTNYINSVAAKDGTVIGLSPGSIATGALFEFKGARYDARQLSWIGSMNSEIAVGYLWHTAPINSVNDIFEKEFLLGATGATDQSATFPVALNRIIGTKFKVVTGYPGSNANALALERGETQGIGSMAYGSLRSTRAHWLKDKKVRVLFQYSFRRHPELQDVPTVIDLAKNDDQRSVLRLVFAQTQMGRSIFGPPGMAPDRLAIHRAAFKAAMQDKELLADADRSKLEIYEPMPGEDMEKLVGSLYQSSPELLKRAREAMLAAEDRKWK